MPALCTHPSTKSSFVRTSSFCALSLSLSLSSAFYLPASSTVMEERRTESSRDPLVLVLVLTSSGLCVFESVVEGASVCLLLAASKVLGQPRQDDLGQPFVPLSSNHKKVFTVARLKVNTGKTHWQRGRVFDGLCGLNNQTAKKINSADGRNFQVNFRFPCHICDQVTASIPSFYTARQAKTLVPSYRLSH